MAPFLPGMILTPPCCPGDLGIHALALGGALGILLGAHLLLTRRIRARAAQAERELAERTAELERAQESLQHLCLTDPLTGLPNRRYLQVSLPEDSAQTLRAYRAYLTGVTDQAPGNADLVLLRVEVDGFTRIANEHGFAAADQVLVQMRDILQRSSRGSDAVIRLGSAAGFLLVARQGSRSEAGVLAERIRRTTEEHPFEIGEGRTIRCTCSLGGSAYPFLIEEPATVGWEKVLAVAEACAEAVQRSSAGQWILAMPSPELRSESLQHDLAGQLPELIQSRLLVVSSSLPETTGLAWKGSPPGLPLLKA